MHFKHFVKLWSILFIDSNTKARRKSAIVFFQKKKEVKIQLKHTEKICAVYEEGSANNQRCQKWFAKFHTGVFSLNIASHLDKQVKTRFH